MTRAMSWNRRAVLGGLAAAAAWPAMPALAKGSRWPAVQALIDGYVADGKVPGAIVGVMAPGRHRPIWMMAGRTMFDGGAPVSTDTLWRVYSMTKPVTGVAIMQQVAAGRLAIDTPIATIMPEFRAMRVLIDPERSLESRPAENPILVRHLLTHTAGFSYTISGNGPLEKEYRRLGLLPMSQPLGQQPGDAPAPALGDYMRRLASVPLRYEPGTRWHYSISLDVAGALLERLTATSLDRVFDRQLFAPLGMRDTGFEVPAGKRARLAGNYVWVDPATLKPSDRPTLVDGPERTEFGERPVMLAGGAGLVSSAADYARFAQMMLNDGIFEGKRLLPANIARMAQANLMPPGVMFGKRDGNGAGGRAILFDEATDPAKYRVGTWGWGGAAGTLFHVDPVRGHAVVLMLQSLARATGGPTEGNLLGAIASDTAQQPGSAGG